MENHAAYATTVATAPSEQRGNAGDALTVDPADRKRRASAALLELAIERAARKR
ncbi:hypothetical protein [Antribacter gilvus]|uniref:hypothetical protein n=1 Tax=Antribacter gilvus TaxID=2304675 RepID=UPI0013E0454B|nr:hypothetical protein [Antribacter gilvus]